MKAERAIVAKDASKGRLGTVPSLTLSRKQWAAVRLSPNNAPRSLTPAALDQVSADELAIAAPAQVMIGDLGMNARMGRPDLERTVVRHDARPAVVGRRTIADRS
jgi:hypothetical protein